MKIKKGGSVKHLLKELEILTNGENFVVSTYGIGRLLEVLSILKNDKDLKKVSRVRKSSAVTETNLVSLVRGTCSKDSRLVKLKEFNGTAFYSTAAKNVKEMNSAIWNATQESRNFYG